MADDRKWKTSFNTDEIDGKLTVDEIIVAADLCEENGFDWVARWMRTAYAAHYSNEPQRKYGWGHSERSAQHFFPEEGSDRTLCGTRILHTWRERVFYHWPGHYCQRCAAELERQKAKYRKAWAAHLEVIEPTCKEPSE